MALKKQIDNFLQRIYLVQDTRTEKFMKSISIQINATDKDFFKHSIAYYLLKYLEEFNGLYTDTMTKERMYSTLTFLSKYFNVYFGFDLNAENDGLTESQWFLYDGTWNDNLYWIDNEYWID